MLGAEIQRDGTRFTVWAPRPASLAVRIAGRPDAPMVRGAGDVWSAIVPGAGAGTKYQLVIDGRQARPDPRSRSQPDGVHGASQVIDPSRYAWRHPAPARRPLIEHVLYELHVGTFTPEGTFAGATARFAELAELGVTAIELMPVAAFPGARNWGYDGVHPFAPAAAYGTPDELRAMIDAAHGAGLAVAMDVVYNHLGPEGNYTGAYAPYFTHDRHSPWGDALDYARPEVRAWAVDNAIMWRDEYRVDLLRLDAIQAIVDDSAEHVLAELTRRVAPTITVAETDLNDVKVFDEWGFDAAWSDDFHHALHALLTGERTGYYAHFDGVPALVRAIEDGWVRGPHPERSRALPPGRFVIATQTHDQVGNRARGDRLAHLVGLPAARLAAVTMLAAAPGVPMLFMGEEFAASTPFQYFTSHGDRGLARAVSAGRKREFKDFAWHGEVPDPQDPATFARSRLDWSEAAREPHAGMRRLYRAAIAARRDFAAIRPSVRRDGATTLIITRGDRLIVVNLSREGTITVPTTRAPLVHSEDRRFGGSLDSPGDQLPPLSAALY